MKKKLITLLLASIVLTGCGAASRNASSQVYMAETAAAYDTASGAGNGMPASFSKSATTNFDSEASFDDSDSAQLSENDILSQNLEKNPDTDPSGSENASAETSQAPMERKLIRNVNMDLETREFEALTKSITDAVTAFGGYIQQSDVSGNSLNWSGDRSSRYSTITARIPSDKLDAFLTEVSSQGNVTYKNESVQDVTLQYTDITSRKKTLQMVYSTVYLSIQEVQVLTSTDPDTILVRIQKGLSRSLNQLQVSSVDFVVWFISSLPILLVLAVLILIVIVVFRKIFRKQGFRKSKKTTKNETKAANVEAKEENK